MPLILTVLILLLLAFLLGRAFASARSRRQESMVVGYGRPAPPPYQRVSDQQLQDRVAVLRGAIERGDVTLDEAAGSLVRFAGGAMTPDRARDLLR